LNAVIHNAGVGYRETRRVETEPGVPSVFAINVATESRRATQSNCSTNRFIRLASSLVVEIGR